MNEQPDGPNINAALVCSRTGVVLGACAEAEHALGPGLEELAAAAVELLDFGAATDFATLLAELNQPERSGNIHELVLISADHVRVVQRSSTRPQCTLVAVLEHTRNLGLLLSTVRARLARLENAR